VVVCACCVATSYQRPDCCDMLGRCTGVCGLFSDLSVALGLHRFRTMKKSQFCALFVVHVLGIHF
jgi:hypothetical protein